MAVAWAAHPPGIRLPLMWTWIQLLRRLGDELGEPGRNAVRRVAPGVVDALVPEWTDEDIVSSGVRAAATGFALIEGVVAALCELSTIRPLLLVLDDLHLADPPSGNALSVLSAQLGRVPIQVIGNWTYFGSGRPVNRSTLERLVRLEAARSIHLHGIGPDAGRARRRARRNRGQRRSIAVCVEPHEWKPLVHSGTRLRRSRPQPTA